MDPLITTMPRYYGIPNTSIGGIPQNIPTNPFYVTQNGGQYTPYYPVQGLPTPSPGSNPYPVVQATSLQTAPIQSGPSLPTSFGMPGLINLPLGAIQLGYGLYQANKLGKTAQPTYGLSNNMQAAISEANNMRNVGFTNQQRQAYESGISTDTASAYRRATSIGSGQVAQNVYAILSGNNTRARNELAIADASQRQQNRAYADNLNQYEQNIKNMNDQMKINEYLRRREAAASLINSGLGNVVSGVTSAAIMGL